MAVIILLMGVQGSGKTAVGLRLSARLGWRFVDADDYHPAANVRKMAAGIALTDEDRAGWLASLRQVIEAAMAAGESLVLACSALKEKYREQLVLPGVKLVYLRGTQELIASRLAQRTGHYAKLNLLPSQFEQLEEPTNAIVVDVDGTVEEVAETVLRAVG